MGHLSDCFFFSQTLSVTQDPQWYTWDYPQHSEPCSRRLDIASIFTLVLASALEPSLLLNLWQEKVPSDFNDLRD